MEIPSKDPFSSIAEGVTKATINSSVNGLKKWIAKFKNKKLAFIQERETIDIVKAQLKSNELSFYKNYVDDPNIKDYILMGLTLRKLEYKSDFDRITNLKEKIYKKYDVEGLHIAQLVQNGALSRYITNLVEDIEDIKILKKQINELLENIEKHVCFVRGDQDSQNISREIKTKLEINSPKIFIVSGIMSASNIVKSISEILENENLGEYSLERYSSQNREIIFLNRIITI